RSDFRWDGGQLKQADKQLTQDRFNSESLKSKPRKRSWAILKVLVLLALLAAAGGGALWWRDEQIRRWKWEPIAMPERMARVPQEWPVTTLAARLQKTQKVRDAATFLEAAAQVGLTKVALGGYRLPDKAGPLDLAKIFKRGPELFEVTFPEGWTISQMADRLAARKFTGAEELRKLAYPSDKPISPWEGRLFPDTYFLPMRGTGKQLLQRLNDRFKEVFAKLPHPFPRGADGKELGANQILILASLVERETFVPEERPIVAGVLLNRLRDNMRLQCDASVQYAFVRAAAATGEGHKERLLYDDLKIESPYNTYLHDGLPPGPICNPGEASLLAAARPQASKYLFYVMSPKLKRHRFAVTFREHKENIALARQERASDSP
ncbi:MAG TPA: endolytic transglycosylase MltG, partial [Abditibacteriaceae bacterium]|nr:endolytic transglycosylase MltG [Abditibacteriaceae bacterium]